ncbi:hypothetical protein OOU_Y34scaffold00533g34 [Pyricularia oryzae Y34]|uniref:Uncharacterized protein n=2 Tax=Pyricularia oryzae TaxID=318829 RepID=A0AA97NYK9_PYRO3|nr:hypothetical protein OOU_Y34scaffold00533g34 [Pyricularia oryzae Y34]
MVYVDMLFFFGRTGPSNISELKPYPRPLCPVKGDAVIGL